MVAAVHLRFCRRHFHCLHLYCCNWRRRRWRCRRRAATVAIAATGTIAAVSDTAVAALITHCGFASGSTNCGGDASRQLCSRCCRRHRRRHRCTFLTQGRCSAAGIQPLTQQLVAAGADRLLLLASLLPVLLSSLVPLPPRQQRHTLLPQRRRQLRIQGCQNLFVAVAAQRQANRSQQHHRGLKRRSCLTAPPHSNEPACHGPDLVCSVPV